MRTIKSICLCLIFFTTACQDNPKNNKSDFKLIDRGSYFIDSFKDIGIYRGNDDKQVMNGYYIVGNELTKWEEFYLEKGILNGNYITYHPNGNKASKGEYVMGKLHGADSTYFLSGKLKSVSNYHKNIRHGKSLNYYESGQISSESLMKNNEFVQSTSYNIIGDIESQSFLKEGSRITQQIKNGKIISEQISSTYDDYEAIKFYNEDGSIKYFLKMVDDSSGKYIIEMDENEKEIRRIDVMKNPQEAMKFAQMFGLL